MPDLQAHLFDLIAVHGYWLVAVVIGLESMGLPLPGEATLISASLYAGHSQGLSIEWVIAAGIAGAVIGDNFGYWIGREAGFRLLVRYGPRVGMNTARIKLGQYLFLRHGGKVVFFGRFVTLLRAMAALLAGTNRMDWRRFLAFNATGACLWAGVYGYGAYLLGGRIHALLGPAGLVLTALAAIAVVSGIVWLRRQEAVLTAAAERAFPGPLLTQPGPPA